METDIMSTTQQRRKAYRTLNSAFAYVLTSATFEDGSVTRFKPGTNDAIELIRQALVAMALKHGITSRGNLR